MMFPAGADATETSCQLMETEHVLKVVVVVAGSSKGNTSLRLDLRLHVTQITEAWRSDSETSENLCLSCYR